MLGFRGFSVLFCATVLCSIVLCCIVLPGVWVCIVPVWGGVSVSGVYCLLSIVCCLWGVGVGVLFIVRIYCVVSISIYLECVYSVYSV